MTGFYKYLTFRKSLNMLKLHLSYRLSSLLKRPIVWGTPVVLQVEPVNYCNLKCVECPAGNGSLTRPHKAMPFALYQKNIDECAENLISVILYFQGEPFLYSNFSQMIKYAHSKNVFTYSSTNGHFLNDDALVESVIRSGLDYLVISVDGMTQEVYEKYRRGGNLQKVMDGIDNLISLKKRLKSSTPFIEMQMVVTAENEHQIDDFKRIFGKKDVQKVSLKSAQIYDFEKGSPLMPKNQQYSRYELCDGKYQLKGGMCNRCWKQWSTAVVTSDGDLVPCCFDKNAEHTFGNVREMNLLKVWKNQVAQAFRKALLRNRKDIDICQNCSE